MFNRTFEKVTRLPVSARRAFDWHLHPGAFERLTPPWDPTKLLAYEGVRDGEKVMLRVVAPWPRKWIAIHEDFIDGVQFKDRQAKGPFPKWVHTHRVEPAPGAGATDPRALPTGHAGECLMRDSISYRLPLGPLGMIAHALFMKRQINAMFDHRHATLFADLVDHATLAGDRRLKVAVTGASGMIGSALSGYLGCGGHQVTPIKRRDGLTFDLDAARGCDVLVHLAGEPIVQRWNKDSRSRIRRSRVDRTRLLVEALARLPERDRPRVLLSGSAVGYYGNGGDDPLSEASGPGEGLLAEVSREWEEAAAPAAELGIRTVLLRTGVVLSPRGGALKKMLPAFKLGLGSRLSKGTQYLPWITLDDQLRAMYHCMFDDRISGPVNLTAPQPVTNAEFTKTLGRVLRRPTVIPAPAPVMRAVFGEMVDEVLLQGQRAAPAVLQQYGFTFKQPHLETALRELLGKF